MTLPTNLCLLNFHKFTVIREKLWWVWEKEFQMWEAVGQVHFLFKAHEYICHIFPLTKTRIKQKSLVSFGPYFQQQTSLPISVTSVRKFVTWMLGMIPVISFLQIIESLLEKLHYRINYGNVQSVWYPRQYPRERRTEF